MPLGAAGLNYRYVHHILPDDPDVQPDPVIGIAKSIVGDITDSSNQAKAFAFMFVTWQISSSVGYVVVPVSLSVSMTRILSYRLLIGGTFSRPADRFPELFTHPFWEQYPYFLPCFITSIIIFSIALFILFFFKEVCFYANVKPSVY